VEKRTELTRKPTRKT